MRHIRHLVSASRQVYPAGVRLQAFLASSKLLRETQALRPSHRRRRMVLCGACLPSGPTTAGMNPAARKGLSLFEVLIALAIFVCSMAAIGQLVSSGVRAAVQARLQSQAVLRAETKMAEAVAGITNLHGASGTFTDDPTWSWAVASTQSQHEGLYLVEVTVAHAGLTTSAKQSFALRRLVRDPQIALDEYAKEQEEAANGTNTSGSSSSSSGNSSGSSGGSSSGGSK